MNMRSKITRSPGGGVFVREGIPFWAGEYVRKDTFEASMQRLEALMEKNMTAQKAMNERLDSKVDGLKGEMKAMNERLDSKVDGLKGEMKAMNERLEAKIDTVNERLENKISAVRNDLRSDIKLLDGKIYALDGKLSQNLVVTGVIVTVFGIIITAVIAAIQFWK